MKEFVYALLLSKEIFNQFDYKFTYQNRRDKLKYLEAKSDDIIVVMIDFDENLILNVEIVTKQKILSVAVNRLKMRYQNNKEEVLSKEDLK